MVYMTFNSSCSFAGVANLLHLRGVEVTDRELALRMKLPWLFAREGGAFLAGPMLQSGKWFDLALRPLGFRLAEAVLPAAEAADYLLSHGPAMLGLRVSPSDKHAVVFTGGTADALHFWNNKWENDPAEEEFTLTPEQLIQRLDDTCVIASLEEAAKSDPDFGPLLAASQEVLRENLRAVEDAARREAPVHELRGLLNPLFRPLLLDGITMLRLIGEDALADRFTVHQSALLSALRGDGEKAVRLCDTLDLPQLERDAEAYAALIAAQMPGATCG